MVQFNEYKNSEFWQHLRDRAESKKSDKVIAAIVAIAFVAAYIIVANIEHF